MSLRSQGSLQTGEPDFRVCCHAHTVEVCQISLRVNNSLSRHVVGDLQKVNRTRRNKTYAIKFQRQDCLSPLRNLREVRHRPGRSLQATGDLLPRVERRVHLRLLSRLLEQRVWGGDVPMALSRNGDASTAPLRICLSSLARDVRSLRKVQPVFFI
jgi:hypothetical protein